MSLLTTQIIIIIKVTKKEKCTKIEEKIPTMNLMKLL